MHSFLANPDVQQALPTKIPPTLSNPKDLKYFKGRFPCGIAQRYTGDRFVLIGDAAGLVRAFKGKGITSAIQTGIRAAEVILRHGISEWAFREYQKANLDITRDLPFG